MLPNVNVQLPNLKDFSLKTLMDEFISVKRTQRLSPKTLAIYTSELRAFACYCDDQAVMTLDQLTAGVVRDYLKSLTVKGRNEGGCHLVYRTLKTFLRWVWDEYELAGLPVIHKVKVRVPRPEPLQGVTQEIVKQLMDASLTLRDKAMMALLFDSGVRAQEACNLIVKDIDTVTGTLSVRHGKGDKSRVTFVGTTTRKLIRKYLSQRNALPTDPLFLSTQEGHLTVWGLRMTIQRLAKRAGIPCPRIHDFRRGCAVEMLRAGADPVTVMRLLGHSDLSTTLRYLKQSNADLQEVHRRTSPMDKV